MHDAPELTPDDSLIRMTNGLDEKPVTDFTVCARAALEAANQLAGVTQEATMTTEHLLLGMMQEDGCAASLVLTSLGFDRLHVEHGVRFMLGGNAGGERSNAVSFSPRFERVVTNACLEAGKRQASKVDTLHLLVALIRERQGVAVMALETPGLGLEPIGGAIMRAFREGVADPE